jgi:hypothetical protein
VAADNALKIAAIGNQLGSDRADFWLYPTINADGSLTLEAKFYELTPEQWRNVRGAYDRTADLCEKQKLYDGFACLFQSKSNAVDKKKDKKKAPKQTGRVKGAHETRSNSHTSDPDWGTFREHIKHVLLAQCFFVQEYNSLRPDPAAPLFREEFDKAMGPIMNEYLGRLKSLNDLRMLSARAKIQLSKDIAARCFPNQKATKKRKGRASRSPKPKPNKKRSYGEKAREKLQAEERLRQQLEKAAERQQKKDARELEKKTTKENHHPVDPLSVPFKEVDRPLVKEGMDRAGCMFLQDAIPEEKRSTFSTTQGIMLECNKEGEENRPDPKSKTYLDEMKLKKIKSIIILCMSACGVYMFLKSYELFHKEVDLQPRWITVDGKLKKFLSEEESEIIMNCAEHKVNFLKIPDKGAYLENTICKIIHHDDDRFKKLAANLRLDIPGIAKTLLALKKMGASAVNYKEKKKSGDQGDGNNNSKRGPIGMGMGYAHASYFHECDGDKVQCKAEFPNMINLWTRPNPEKDASTKEEREEFHYKHMYEAIGDLADVMMNFVDQHFTDDQPHFPDQERTDRAGATFRNAMGSKHCRACAAYASLTCLGKLEALLEMSNKKLKKLWTLLRHQDGPNDHRPGYDITFIYWSCFVMEDGNVYRLAIIFYSRKSIGDALEKEEKWMKPALKLLEEYLDPRDIDFKKRLELEDINWHSLGAEVCKEHCSSQLCPDLPKQKYRRTRAIPNPDGYNSLLADSINKLVEDYHLADQTPESYRHVLALCYIATVSASSWAVDMVFRSWSKEGAHPLQVSKKTHKITCANLILHYLQTCKQLNISPGNPGKKGAPRFMVSSVTKVFAGMTKPKSNKILDGMAKAAIACNFFEGNKFAELHAEIDRLVDGMGSVGSVQFFPILSMVGVIYTPRGRRIALEAELTGKSAFGKFLKDILGVPADQMQKILRRLAKLRKELLCWTENLSCKAARWSPDCGKKVAETGVKGSGNRQEIFDFYREDQWVYARVMEEEEGNKFLVVNIYRRRIKDGPKGNWEKWGRQIPNPDKLH